MNGAKLGIKGEAVTWAPTDVDSIVVLDLRTSRYLSLNASGSMLWLRLVDGATYADLRSTLVAKFGLDDSSADTDIDGFLGALRSRDLLVEN